MIHSCGMKPGPEEPRRRKDPGEGQGQTLTIYGGRESKQDNQAGGTRGTGGSPETRGGELFKAKQEVRRGNLIDAERRRNSRQNNGTQTGKQQHSPSSETLTLCPFYILL